MFVPNVSPLKINSYRFNTNSANEKNNYELLSKYVNNSVKITFTGSNRNPNQIAVMSAECGPYAVIGGLGTVTRDMTKAYKIAYPHKDIRIFLPFYNSEYNGARNLDGKNTFYTSEIRDGKKINGTPYQVEDTGIETDFSYGVKKSKAKLFKISCTVFQKNLFPFRIYKYTKYLINCKIYLKKFQRISENFLYLAKHDNLE